MFNAVYNETVAFIHNDTSVWQVGGSKYIFNRHRELSGEITETNIYAKGDDALATTLIDLR